MNNNTLKTKFCEQNLSVALEFDAQIQIEYRSMHPMTSASPDSYNFTFSTFF
jgi:hypothetical protein